MANHPNQIGISPYAYAWNNPIYWTDPTGLCPTCPDNAEEGATHEWAGATFIYTNGEWATPLPEVTVTPNGASGSWTSEVNEWDYGDTYEQYQQDYPEFAGKSQLEAKSYWNQFYRDDFFQAWNVTVQQARERIAVQKMTWFIQGATTAGAMGMGALGNGSLASSKSFSYTPRGMNLPKQVHGNSLSSTRPTWGYKLYETNGTFLKNGITSEKAPELRYTKAFMSDKKMVPFKQFPNRLEAWQWEFQQNQILRGPLNKNMH
jgi:hypothetical protein